MEYRVIRTGQSDDHIEHALFGGGRQKGAQNKNHKYLARAWWQNKWRYAYTQAEVKALQNLGKARQAAKDIGDKAKAGAAKVTKTVSDVASGKYARDVDSRADRYAESAAQRSAASKRQSASGREQQEMYRTANKVAEYNEEKANKFTNKLTGKSKMYKEAATSDRNAAKTAAAEGSRLISMSRENSAAARSDAKKAAEAEAEKNTAAYKISKAAGNASRAAREAADRVSDTARDVGNRVSNAARSAADSVRNSSAGRYVSNTAEARRAERERDEATASGNRQAAIDAENRRENAETQRRNAASDARNAVSSVAERGRAAAERVANRVSNAARGAGIRAVDATEDVLGDALDAGSKASKAVRGAGKRAVDATVDAIEDVLGDALDAGSKASKAVRGAASKVSDAVRDYTDKKVLSGQHAREVDEDYNRSKEDYTKQRRVISDIVERNNKLHDEYTNAPYLERLLRFNDTLAKSINQIDAYERANKNANASSEKLADAIEKKQEGTYKVSKAIDNAQNTARKVTDKGKAAVEKLLNRVSSAAKAATENIGDTAKQVGKSASEKGKAAAEKLLNRASSTARDVGSKVSDAARSAVERVANTETGRKISDTAERVADKVADAKESAQHKSYANEMKRKYGADSLHYKDAQALLDHDKAVDDLAKAREKYGVNSSEYKAAMRKEQSTRDAMDEVHEQNLYANNAQYKKISDQASALGSYIDNMDARGGPQTTEGKANYRKAIQDLERLEAQLERMWNEDWE